MVRIRRKPAGHDVGGRYFNEKSVYQRLSLTSRNLARYNNRQWTRQR